MLDPGPAAQQQAAKQTAAKSLFQPPRRPSRAVSFISLPSIGAAVLPPVARLATQSHHPPQTLPSPRPHAEEAARASPRAAPQPQYPLQAERRRTHPSSSGWTLVWIWLHSLNNATRNHQKRSKKSMSSSPLLQRCASRQAKSELMKSLPSLAHHHHRPGSTCT